MKQLADNTPKFHQYTQMDRQNIFLKILAVNLVLLCNLKEYNKIYKVNLF
jgi:hypothetical protein